MLKGLVLFMSLIVSLVSVSETTVDYNYDEYDKRLYQAFVTGKMDDWRKVINELEVLVSISPSPTTRFKLLHAQYGYIGYLLGNKQIDKAEKLIEKAEVNANILVKSSNYKSSSKAIQAALLAYRISISPYKVPFLGPKSASLINEALSIDPSNIYAIIEKGNAMHYAPSIVGGNPIEAIAYYRKAIEQIELEKPLKKTWWYINTYTQMGLAAKKAGDKRLAKNIYLKILAIEPNYKWVRDELLPSLSEKD